MIEAFICRACGVQHEPAEDPPAACAICEDARQFVPASGQAWISPDQLRGEGRRNEFRELEAGLHGFRTEPVFAIGQRSLLLQTPHGNLLWDVQSLIDTQTLERLDELGGVAAIAASHPHFYGAMVDWSEALGDVPIHLPAADRRWVMRRSGSVAFWEGRSEILPGLTAIRCGGHFEGGAVLHWAAGAGGRGVLLTGDTVMVVPAPGWVSFMRSYPNLIPLPARQVRFIAATLAPLRFDRIYGNPGWEKVIVDGAAGAVRRSAERYGEALGPGE